MRSFSLALMVLFALVACSDAQITQTGAGKVANGGGGGGCSNSVDFSDACNSANLVILGGFF